MPTARQVRNRLALVDMLEVAAPCFQDGSFMLGGELKQPCPHTGRVAGRGCREEYYCEVIAAYILMPENSFNEDLAHLRDTWRPNAGWHPLWWLAQVYRTPLWSVRFRICLMDEEHFDPYRWEPSPAFADGLYPGSRRLDALLDSRT